jgi:hypothetical protein
MALTPGGTPYVESSDLVADYPTVSLALAEHIDTIGGGILQVLFSDTTTEATSTSTTYADSNLSASITPSLTSSKILIILSQSFRVDGTAEAQGSIKIVRDSTDIWLPGQDFALATGSAAGTFTDMRSFFAMTYLDSPNTTSATTYKTQFNRNAGTCRVQPNSTRSSIILMEVAG